MEILTWMPSLSPLLYPHQWLPQRFFLRFWWFSTRGSLILFLFTLVADAFSQILLKGEKQNLFKGFRVEKQLTPLLHLQYADDTLLFLDGEGSQLSNLISLIHCFKLVFGMRTNWQKSCLVGINTPLIIFGDCRNLTMPHSHLPD